MSSGYFLHTVDAEVTNIEEVVQEDPTDEEAENVTAITSDFSKTVSRASTGSDYESSGATFGSSYNFLPPTYVYSTNSGLSYESPSASESLDTSGSSYESSPTSTFSYKVFIASGGENWVWTPGIEPSAAQNGNHEPVAASLVGDEVISDGGEGNSHKLKSSWKACLNRRFVKCRTTGGS